MQFSTTPTLEGQPIVEYCGVMTGEAILGIDIDYETVGKDSSMLMASVSGTAVKTRR